MSAFNAPVAAFQADTVDKVIRDFMDLDHLESLSPKPLPIRESWEMHDFDKHFEEIMNRLHKLRIEVKNLARISTCGDYTTYLQERIDLHKDTHMQATFEVQKQYEKNVDDILAKEGLNPEAMKEANCAVYCASKMKKSLSGRFARCLKAAATIRDLRLADLDRAIDLTDKHWALIILAQNEVVWNPSPAQNGGLQGHMWTDGFYEPQVTKLEKGVYKVRVMWTAFEDALWRPGQVTITRGLDGQNESRICWIGHEKRTWSDFPLEVIVRDEFMCEKSDEDQEAMAPIEELEGGKKSKWSAIFGGKKECIMDKLA